jgi:L-threonylcarbamoyladenylate synthase
MSLSEQDDIVRAAELLRAGRLVAFPTETVYGLGANALDAAAVARIFEAKGRPATSPVIVHVPSVDLARAIVAEWPTAAEALARRFWPGPLTLVMRKHRRIPEQVTAGLDTVGIRVPAHRLAQALLRAAGLPVAAPSANRFSELSPTTAEHVRESLGERVDFVLDGGPTAVGIESTVLSLAMEPPCILRPGMVSKEDIESVIGPVVVGGADAPAGVGHASPGLHPKHYSPHTRLLLVADGALPAGRGVYVFRTKPAPAAERNVGMPATADAYAAQLYGTLHELDHESWDWIAVEQPPDNSEWAAILDRLRRASAP